MNMTNLPKHPCAGKCTNFKNEQCNNCMIPAVEFDADFAVGDSIVIKSALYECDEIFEIDRIGRDGELYDTRWRMLHIEHFRHATPAELRAKKRLPDPVALFVPNLDDADVEKHHQRAIQAQGEMS